MYEMLRNNAANIHETEDWDVVFAVIEIVGAGASPDDQVPGDLQIKIRIRYYSGGLKPKCPNTGNIFFLVEKIFQPKIWFYIIEKLFCHVTW